MRSQYGNFDHIVRSKISQISQWMKQNNYTTVHMHEILDKDGNGHVDKLEFVGGLEIMNIPGLTKKDYN